MRALVFWLMGLLMLAAVLTFIEVVDAVSAALAVLDVVTS